MALLDDPDRSLAVLERLTGWSIALAVAQVRRGAAAIKVSSPFAGRSFLGTDMYEQFILPFESRLARAVREAGDLPPQPQSGLGRRRGGGLLTVGDCGTESGSD